MITMKEMESKTEGELATLTRAALATEVINLRKQRQDNFDISKFWREKAETAEAQIAKEVDSAGQLMTANNKIDHLKDAISNLVRAI